MAWNENLQECSFRGIVFDALKTDDSADRATAEHAYPYLDGADIEDLGRGARRISIEAFFWDGLVSNGSATAASTVESGYENRLQELLKALDGAGPGELIHPIFGSIKSAQVTRYSIRHEAENVDQCSVSIDFVESTPGNPFFDRTLAAQQSDAVGLKGDVARSKLATGLSSLINTLRANNPLALFNDLRAALTLPLLAVLSEVQGVLMSGLDLIAAPMAFCNDLSSLVDGVLNLKDFGNTVLADFRSMGRIFNLFEVFGFSSSSSSPSSPVFLNGVPTEEQAIAAVEAHVSAQTAIGLATAAGLVLASESETATLSPLEIETIANTARDSLEAAIVSLRATFPMEAARPMVEALKDQALAVQLAARAVIEARPPLLYRAVPVTGNLRLQAHAWYGDHTRATELLRMNPLLRQPNFIAQGDVLHAFSR